jgi:serine/threonine-protein kinase
MTTANNTQYIIQRKLGEGGMGVVYLAEDTLLERQVAIKELIMAKAPVSESLGNRFQQEALALARLNHPNITHLYAFIPKDDTYWMVMEFVNGKTLEEWLKINGTMQPAVACSILVQMLDGLHHAHRKSIIHRDLKPSNVMISEEGEVKITDFGIARIKNSQRITQHGKSVGTLEYMAPEQIQGKEGDERTDVYAAGNILYELLCGQPPFKADTDYHLMKAKLEETPPLLPALLTVTPPSLKQIILKALDRNPEKRFESVTSFKEALNQCMQHSFLKETALIQALTNPFTPQTSIQSAPNTVLSNAQPGALKSLSFLNTLSQHGRQVSGQFSRLFSANADDRPGEGQSKKSFFARIQQRVTDNPLAFLLIVVFICGLLLIWNYFSGTPSGYAANAKDQGSSDTSNQEDNKAANTYIIETQLSKVPVVTKAPDEGKDEEAKEKPKEDEEEDKTKDTPKDTRKKTPKQTPKPKTTTPVTEKPDETTEEPVTTEPEPIPVKREPTGPVTIPAGRSISLVLDETLSSEQPERDGDIIRLRSADDIVVQGRTIIKKGAVATGKIVDVVPSTKRKKAVIGFVIQRVEGSNGSMLKLDSERFKMVASSLGSPVTYRTGQIFSARLGRGRFE